MELSDAQPTMCNMTETPQTDSSRIMMFGADWCIDCRRAKQTFTALNVDVQYIDLETDPAAADIARDISGRTNIPVIVYPDQSFQVEPSNAEITQKVRELGLENTK